MKLITKTIIYYLLISLPLLLIAGFISYFLIRQELKDGTDDALWKEKVTIEKQIYLFKKTKTIYLSLDSLSYIKPVNQVYSNFKFSDVSIIDKLENEILDYRILQSFYISKNQTYLIHLSKPTLEDDELLEGLYSSFALIIFFLLLAFFLVNWVISKTLWKPFYQTLQQLNTYDLKNKSNINFKIATTKEFKQLNTALVKMTDKIYLDYSQQKQFTENASHEMQTPLAIIKISLDNLFQSTNFKEEELIILQNIETSVNKLSQLNKSLLLLTKIENNQFNNYEEINLNTLVTKLVSDYQFIYESKNIKLIILNYESIKIKINTILADLIFGNLINNAFKHTIVNGNIEIKLKNNSFTISNSGKALSFNENDLFNRFKKDEASKDSLGLGLAIVKSIADNYKFKISYTFNNNLHTFTMAF